MHVFHHYTYARFHNLLTKFCWYNYLYTCNIIMFEVLELHDLIVYIFLFYTICIISLFLYLQSKHFIFLIDLKFVFVFYELLFLIIILRILYVHYRYFRVGYLSLSFYFSWLFIQNLDINIYKNIFVLLQLDILNIWKLL